ncbi:S-methyl-5-thioribose-1-phosphate isomerase [Gammaproteobacteria bacterium AB-CW1]|uniref:Methylthioribose-1-phosphate isomerase n=1 Tax=Natronospira elongata TaxID=3110268 RepID=A0AAP6JGH1_9GAMM|nr:S-methyl-5-thioribose-1-phosphate isomerase [Gammaproteobacteria bacterium AB-CW1]
MLKPLLWKPEEGVLEVLDQRLLPAETRWLRCDSASAVAEAIAGMAVRGAPAIGIAAAWGAVLAIRSVAGQEDWRQGFDRQMAALGAVRPTAVNLGWAINRMRESVAGVERAEDAVSACEAEAARIEAADLAANRRIGELGSRLLPDGVTVLTHCNTGALATGGHGTALGIIRSAWERGALKGVIATETRPWLQGARLTSWELAEDGIPVSLIVDSAAAALMAAGRVDAVIIGADRISRQGDVANKIGSYGLAVAARAHDIPFIVAAPSSTIDPRLARGDDIEIEHREASEIWAAAGLSRAPKGVETLNPAFDITPAGLVSAIVTEKGICSPAEGQGMELLQPSA